jgi:two-component system cell cycle response regulator
LRRRLRRTDIAARLGGDEFEISMPQTDGAGAGVVLESIRDSVAAMAPVRNVPLTTSVDAWVFTRVPADVDTMLRESDKPMYGAKRAGRNRIRSGVVGGGSVAPTAAEA